MEKCDTLIQMNLKKLEEVVGGGGLQESFHHMEIHGVCIDSKSIKEGNVFVPVIRVKDGHEYVKEAMGIVLLKGSSGMALEEIVQNWI